MKKLLAGIIACLIIIAACHRKTVPAVVETPPPPAAPAAPVVPVVAAADLEAGKRIYETKCIRCHTAKPVDTYTEARWVGILRSMVPKARLDSLQTAQLTLYVNANAKKS